MIKRYANVGRLVGLSCASQEKTSSRSARLQVEPLEARFLLAELGTNPEIEVRTLSETVLIDNVSILDFGTAVQGHVDASQTMVVRNIGNGPLTLGNVSVPRGFLVVDRLTSRLVPNASDLLTIQLDSRMPGVHTGQLSFATNDADENPFNFTVTGRVITPLPEIEVKTSTGQLVNDGVTTVDLGTVVQGQINPGLTFIVRNLGHAPLTLGTISVPRGFRVLDGLTSRLAPNASDVLTIQLDTRFLGVQTGRISFATNDANENPFSFTLTGRVVTPTPEIEVKMSTGEVVKSGQTTIDLGTVVQGQMNSGLTFVVRNLGHASLTLGSASVPRGFRVLDGLASRLAPGASDLLTIQLDTRFLGVQSGRFSFATNDADENPFTFTITGRVVTPAPEIEVKTPTGEVVKDGATIIDLGTIVQGQTNPGFTFVVRNVGHAPLTLGTVSVPRGFRVVDRLTSRLAPQASDLLTIQLDTRFLGVQTGQLSFATNDADENPFTFTVTGNVVTPVPEIEVKTSTGEVVKDGTAMIDFGTVIQGQGNSGVTFVVRNVGHALLTLESLSVPRGFRVVDGLASRLAPNASDLLTIQLDTRFLGVQTGQVSFATNDANENPFNFTVNGRVVMPAPEIDVKTSNGETVNDGSTTIDLGTVVRGQTNPGMTFVVRNVGHAALFLEALSVPRGFRVVDGLTSRLAPNASDLLTIQLDTRFLGVRTGQVSFATNDADEHPFNFTVTGSVVTPAPAIEVKTLAGEVVNDGTTTINLGTVVRGQTNPGFTLVVRNAGHAPLTLGTVVVPRGFRVVDQLTSQLGPDASDLLTIQLDTRLLGVHTGQVSFATNDVDKNPFNFTVIGRVT